MKNKTCGECKYFEVDEIAATCEKHCIICDDNTPACKKFEQKHLTNYDVIRQMSNGAFAFFMTRLILDGCPISKSKTMCDCKVSNDCVSCLKNWLNAPAESEVYNETTSN